MIDCNLIIGQDRKRELLLRSPLLPAAGALGHAPLEGAMWRRDLLGAFATPPLGGEHGPSPNPPQVLNTSAGALIAPASGPPLRIAVRRHSREWLHWGLPVVVALCPATAGEASHMAEVLARHEWVQGVELHLVDEMAADGVDGCVRAIRGESDVPCLVRVPFGSSLELAIVAQEAGADGIIVAAPPSGRLRVADRRWVKGDLHSPALVPLYAERVHQVAAGVTVPIIARGEMASAQDALTMLAAGAAALQFASILWVRPSIIADVYAALEGEMAARSVSRWDDLLVALQQGGDDPTEA